MFQKLYRLLEGIDDNTRHQTEALNNTTAAIREIGMQITTRSESDDSKVVLTPATKDKGNKLIVVFSCLGVLFLIVFFYFSLQLLHTTQNMIRQSDEVKTSRNAIYTSYKELAIRQAGTSEQVTRLDSIVSSQNRMIEELKKLNETAVRTFIRIKKEIERKNRTNDETMQDRVQHP